MLHKCKQCGELKVRERNGIRLSKLCSSCKNFKITEKKEKHKLTKTYQKSRLKKLKAQCWKLVSEYVRRKDADEFGRVKCYTCDKIMPWQEAHCGHFHHGVLDYDLRNLHVQDAGCNTYRHGNLSVYGTRLALELGLEEMQQLELDSHTVKYTIEDLENLIPIFQAKLDAL